MMNDHEQEMMIEYDADKLNISVLQRACPILMFSTFFHTPGTLDIMNARLKDHSGLKSLLEAQMAYYRSDIECAYELTKQSMSESLTFNAHIGAGMLMALCAMNDGNVALWEEARAYTAACPCKNEKELQLCKFGLAIIDSFIYDNRNLPDWFRQGCFDDIPLDAFPYVRYLFIRYVIFDSRSLLHESKRSKEYIETMKNIAKMCELMITQTNVEKAVLAEIYLRIMGAIAYHNYGRDDNAKLHLRKAILLAIPDRLFQPFIEYQIDLDSLLEQEFRQIDYKLWLEIKNKFKRLLEGWASLHYIKLNKTKSVELTIREREVSRLAASGLSNVEIAERLQISLNTVKHTIHHAMEKTGCQKRSDLIYFI